MKFSTFSDYLKRIEHTSSRNEMTEILAALLKETSVEEIDQVVYLALGNLGPPYNRVEFGLSDKLMFKVIATAVGLPEDEVKEEYKKVGDLGEVVFEKLKVKNEKLKVDLSVGEVFMKLKEIAEVAGQGSQEKKIHDLAELFSQTDRLSAKYITRIPLGKLRLGFSDVTILDALSWMLTGDKSLRKELERGFNVSADIGRIAGLVKKRGIDGIKEVQVEVGVPIRPAAAERLPTAETIIEKLGRVGAEPKIDGFRLQCHFKKRIQDIGHRTQSNAGTMVKLFSRNLEDMSEMFPEIVEAVRSLRVESIIFEGEAVAYNPATDEFLPFQETVQRRRKYDVEKKAAETPLKLFGFDLLYLNGENYLDRLYRERRKKLASVIGNRSDTLRVVEEAEYADPEALSEFFLEQIENGLEGIMAKRLDAPYAAGARNFNWVKLKREDKGELDDTIDCVVMGYKAGMGKRANFGIGAFLVGVYDEDEDVFKTISKVGTGLTDDQWREMRVRADALSVKSKPARYDVPKELEQDVWIRPAMVVEILADEITRSPLHTAGRKVEPGYALRFPRLIQWRDDKEPEQATTVKEIKTLFNQQKSR